MIYATILTIIGYHTITQASGDILCDVIGLVIFALGVIFGYAIEDRLDNKIKTLEKELNELKNKYR